MPAPTEQQPDPREEILDGPLDVAGWDTPLTPKVQEDIPAGAPSWWHGEAAASDEFFRSMGITVGPDGQVIKR